MSSSPCASCGQPADPSGPCPHCGHTPPVFVTELGRLDRDLAEMSQQDMALQKSIKELSAKIQAARHQRALLAHAQEQQQRRNTPRQRSMLRRRPTATPGGGRRTPAAPTASTTSTVRGPRTPPAATPPKQPAGPPPAEPAQPGSTRPGPAQPGSTTPGPANPAAAPAQPGAPRSPGGGPPRAAAAGAGTATRPGGAPQGASARRTETAPPGTDRSTGSPPPGAGRRTQTTGRPGRPAGAPRQPHGGMVGEPLAEDPTSGPPFTEPHPGIRPEASSRSVQNVLLILGGLLLGVAAIAFGAVAISSMDRLTRSVILLLATVLTLMVPPLVARRGLTSTAETIAAIGLTLVPLDGYAVWTIGPFGLHALPGEFFGGLVCAVTVVVAAIYMTLSGLTVPRFAIVLAIQPVVPLLAYTWIDGPAGWALVLAAVAAVDAGLGGMLGQASLPAPDRLDPDAPGRDGGRADRPPADRVAADRSAAESVATGRVGARRDPEGAGRPQPEPTAPGDRLAGTFQSPLAVAAATFWLRELTWVVFGLALGASMVYSGAALITADAVPAALRAAITLLIAAMVGVVGALTLRQRPLPDVAAGLMTLAIIASVSRVAAVALPGRALVLIAAAVAIAGLGVRALPEWARRGPQLASAVALAALGVVVAGNVVRAAVAPVRAALPMWKADLSRYSGRLADAVSPAGWQLVVAAVLLTVAAALALPPQVRREAAVLGTALSGLAAPASLGLGWAVTPWLLIGIAIAIGATGLVAPSNPGPRSSLGWGANGRELLNDNVDTPAGWGLGRRTQLVHVAAAGVVGLAGAGAALARPWLTGAVLAALTIAGVLIKLAERLEPERSGGQVLAGEGRSAPPPAPSVGVGDWALGGAAFALPGAVAGSVASLATTATPILTTSFLAVCCSLGYAAVNQVAHRRISIPLTLGSGLAALAVTAAAFGAKDASVADVWVGALLLVSAVLLFLAPSIDSGRRADRVLDGSDFAAAAVTAATIAALARVGALALPGSELATTAALVLIVALGVRAMPDEWRRGPILGSAASASLIAAIAGYSALRDGVRALSTSGQIWAGHLDKWPGAGGAGATAWQAPIALLFLAAAAAVVLPRPAGYDVAAVGVGLATIGAPVAMGLPWWSPIVVGGAVATAYGIASVIARDPRAGMARVVLATAVALHAVAASLVRPWTTAAALGVISLVGTVVAILAIVVARLDLLAPEPDLRLAPGGIAPQTFPPTHLAPIGGAAVTGALLALPGAVAALAAELGYTADVVLTGALGASSLGLAIVALARRSAPQYLGYATVGVAGGATATAIACLPTSEPTGVYAAGAVLLGVIAELLRASSFDRETSWDAGQWRSRYVATGREPRGATVRRWRIGAVRELSISPARGALAVSALPAALAVFMIVPPLFTALVTPYKTLDHVWGGPPAALANPAAGSATDAASVLAALMLTIAAALAAVGFSRGSAAQTFPVVLPGIAVTLLIAPVALGIAWPAATMAALSVFTISSLGVALTPPPPHTDEARPLKVTRQAVFFLGQLAGGAGLAGSLATKPLTLFTLTGAVGVGVAAALGGRTQTARILGWLFTAGSAQGLVLTAGLIAGLPARSSAFGVLVVGAAFLVLSSTMPRLRRPEAFRETATVEWSGYAAALLAMALAFDSPQYLAALLAAWGAVLGLAALRPDRRPAEQYALYGAIAGCEVVAWWLLMTISKVALPEAYTLPFAALALLIGYLIAREREDLNSWAVYGPALIAAFLPTITIVLVTNASAARQVLLLVGAVATLIAGSMSRQRAPVVVGGIVTAIAALRLLTEYGPWFVLVPLGLVLMALGANFEKRRRDIQRLRGALTRMR